MTTQTAWNTFYSNSSSPEYTALTNVISRATRETYETKNESGFALKEVSVSLAKSAKDSF